MNLFLVIIVVNIALALGADSTSIIGRLLDSQSKMVTQHFNIHQRIYNGETADEGQFPYIVYLSLPVNDGKVTMCGGSIIGHTWILTAAHCTYHAKSVKIFYGTTKSNEGQFSHEVGRDNIIQHDRYDDITLENDVALIRTPHVDFSDKVNKVELADRDNDYADKWATASGWGDTSDNGDTAQDLQYAKFQILSKDKCWEAIGGESDNMRQ